MAKYLNDTSLQELVTKIKALIPSALKSPYSITIQKNGSSLGSYDGSEAKTINVSVPTKTSELTNDSGYKTTDNNTTYSLTQDASDGHKITLTPSSG